MTQIVTVDLSQFGYRELKEAKNLIEAYIDNKQNLDVGYGLKLCFNTHSGYVFLTDDDLRVYMTNDETGELEEWFYCPNCGCEGFRDYVTDIDNHLGNDVECREFIQQLKEG